MRLKPVLEPQKPLPLLYAHKNSFFIPTITKENRKDSEIQKLLFMENPKNTEEEVHGGPYRFIFPSF